MLELNLSADYVAKLPTIAPNTLLIAFSFRGANAAKQPNIAPYRLTIASIRESGSLGRLAF